MERRLEALFHARLDLRVAGESAQAFASLNFVSATNQFGSQPSSPVYPHANQPDSSSLETSVLIFACIVPSLAASRPPTSACEVVTTGLGAATFRPLGMASTTDADHKELLERAVAQVQKELFPGHQPDNGAPADPEALHAFFPPVYAGCWAIYRECVVSDGSRTRRNKEPIAATISSSNGCKCCTTSHTNFAVAAGADGYSLRASIAAGDPSLLTEENVRKVCSWAKECQRRDAPALKEVPPFNMNEAPEIIGTIHMFNYLNRIVQKYLTTDLVLPAFPWPVKLLLRAFPFLQRPFFDLFFFSQLGKTVKEVGPLKQGASLEILVVDSQLPGEFQWAQRNASVAKAFTYWSWAMGELANKYIPKEVTKHVGKYIDEKYTGEAPPAANKWVYRVAKETGLSEAHQSAVRYMLLMSFARFQIDGAIKRALARHFPDGRTQRAMGMWAAFKTASAVSKWQGECALNYLPTGDITGR
ncbi:unnamed protein product [Ostreobium quekettii]|uniref:Carboxymuconolactone decarboxylase-like domain-containing protein n=1 Tax=Ostreobium quekettii TaxID=121088 RepID=A0A8S1J5W9_9CHLO|nr:unnamed protein product [Ostreobium quekettii]